MTRKKLTVLQLATEAEVELDECLILLWDEGLDYLTGPGSFLAKGDASRAKRSLGLATRRELADIDHWQSVLGVTSDELPALFEQLGVASPFQGGQLTKRAIHRLRAESRRRGLRPPTDSEGLPQLAVVDLHTPLVWQLIGHQRKMAYLTADQVVGFHEALAEDFREDSDPISPAGVKNPDLLASAVHRPHTSIGESLKYPTIEMAAAALLHGMVHNHPFHNGNKRTALVAMLVFLDENSMVLTCDEDALFKLVLQLAQHALAQGPSTELADREVLKVATWLSDNCRWIELGDRALQWRRLERILMDHGCTFDFPTGTGNRVNIERDIRVPKKLFKKEHTVRLHTQTFYGGSGRECERNMINRIRKDLHLDDEHGVDSGAFYDRDVIAASDFIVKYRKTLKRLARL